ncbi:TetR/AcrR family transcriptional regulator [Nocardia brasiliensis]|uniref:TetR/AcrR family transcriptional regulator n=1 Tax=Nocardia brasiliensis TaxID=37326 RepID=UPI0024543F61|nr:TetR/AcrR family transcriptional regulator [Nocardia brasiliensis]
MTARTRQIGSPGRRGRSKGDQREAAILDTARRLLAEQPLSSITIDQLAKGAGLSRSAFYFYFDSRDAVVHALVGASLVGLSAIVEEFDRTTPPRAAIRHAVARYLQRWRTEGTLLRAFAPASSRDAHLDDTWRATHADIHQRIVALIDTERAADRAPAGPPDSGALAAALLAMMWRAGYEYAADEPDVAETERRVDALTAVFVRTIWCTPD